MNPDEQAIRNLIAEWHRATAASDVDAVLCLMSEDVVFLVSGKPPMKGRDAFEKGLRELLKSHRIESSGEVQECEVSGDLAYCWTLLTVRITPLSGGDERAIRQRIVSFPQADQWLMAVSARRESVAPDKLTMHCRRQARYAWF